MPAILNSVETVYCKCFISWLWQLALWDLQMKILLSYLYSNVIPFIMFDIANKHNVRQLSLQINGNKFNLQIKKF